jgi:hypothetical protein
VGRVLEDSVLQEIAKAHGRSAAQFVLRRLLQQGVIALSRTVSPEHVIGNIQVFDFVLATTEVAAIHGSAENPQVLSPQWDPTPAAEGQSRVKDRSNWLIELYGIRAERYKMIRESSTEAYIPAGWRRAAVVHLLRATRRAPLAYFQKIGRNHWLVMSFEIRQSCVLFAHGGTKMRLKSDCCRFRRAR